VSGQAQSSVPANRIHILQQRRHGEIDILLVVHAHEDEQRQNRDHENRFQKQFRIHSSVWRRLGQHFDKRSKFAYKRREAPQMITDPQKILGARRDAKFCLLRGFETGDGKSPLQTYDGIVTGFSQQNRRSMMLRILAFEPRQP